MKLIKCYIQNFGKLQNFNYDFQDGINIIKQDNGFGKTTFATFIKSMFYGLDTSSNARVEKSDRKKYIPWQGGIYGGNIEFEVAGKRYRIERTFGNKASEDTFKLYNLDTNLESIDFTENIGEEIFKINKSAYERSTYIPQGQIQIDMEDSISAKLSNMLESDNDINTSEDALKKLGEIKKTYKKDRGQGGLIDEKTHKLYEFQRKFENSRSDIETLEIKRSQLDQKIVETKELENVRNDEQELLTKKIEQDRIKAKKETYDTLVNKFRQSKNEYNKLDEFFSKGVATDIFLENLSNKNYEIEKTNIEIDNCKISDDELNELNPLQNKFKNGNITLDEINNKIFEYSRIQEIDNDIQEKKNEKNVKQDNLQHAKSKRRKNVLFIFLSLAFIALGFVLIFAEIYKMGGIASIVLGVVFALISLIGKNNGNKISVLNNEIINLEREIQELSNEKFDINLKIDNFLKLYNFNENTNKIIDLTNLKTEYNKYKELLNNKLAKELAMQKAIFKKETLKREIEHGLSDYFSSFEKSYPELLQDLRMYKNQFEISKAQLMDATAEKEKFEKENNVEVFKNMEEINMSEEEIKQKIDDTNKKIDILVDEKNQIKNQIEVLENKTDDDEYLESDIENLKEEINQLEQKYKILKTTEELLKASKESFSSSYLQGMIIGFKKYLSIINEDELNTKVDINLDVTVDVNGSQKEIKNFSAGYKDLIYICMRFSLIDALFNEETPFVVLDDPFVNLDETKTSKALEILDEFAKKYQVIYFSCNSSRV